ncbi:uncharacterized protein LOC121383728 [Gigantopelta aegis]|uniref:uncharacterized protein LOC121383728 n=1 Tax=Gigantopelta aegis TaxID=1735272 RepID=UPI001B88E394|nr:uncharacterized protein LOC121383728 [Gigantopelta aegis]
MLAGLRKSNMKPDFRRPIMKCILHQLINSLDLLHLSGYNRIMIKAMFLLAFHAFLRVGEITCNGNSKNILQMSNLQFFRRGMKYPSRLKISFHTFKGHYNKAPITLVLNSQLSENLCPVVTLFQYIKERGPAPGSIFRFPGGITISYRYFCSTRSHSFRIGAASTAAEQGVSKTDIQAMGRWHSNAFKSYIRIPSFEVR